MFNVYTQPGGTSYAPIIVGDPDGMTHIKLDVSTLTTDEVDANGNLKPGVLLQANGALVTAAGQSGYGVTIEASKILTGNTALATDTSDPVIAVCTNGLVNRDIVEDNLGRALSANEVAAYAAGGCRLQLTTT